jgi:hypothetical protein
MGSVEVRRTSPLQWSVLSQAETGRSLAVHATLRLKNDVSMRRIMEKQNTEGGGGQQDKEDSAERKGTEERRSGAEGVAD